MALDSKIVLSRPSLVLLVIVAATYISQVSGVVRYPATVETKGGRDSGSAIVDLKNVDFYDQTYFTYEATFVMGSSTKIVIRGSSADGDKIIQNERVPGENFARVIRQTVTKTRDGNGININVYLDTILKLEGVKEKYGKSSIGVRIVRAQGPHFWDIKHEYSNNYEGEDKGEICLGCEEEEKEVAPVVRTTPTPVDDGPGWDSLPYAYKYAVDDSPSQNLYQSDVQSNGQAIRGEYRVLLPDGRMQIVTYTADWKNGYVPVVKYA